MNDLFMYKKRDWTFLFLLVILLLAVRLPSLDEPLDNDSGGNAFFAREIIRGHPLYETFHPTHHLPGVYYTYALAFKLLGDDATAPKIFLLPWMFTCALLIFSMGRMFIDETSGRLGAVFYVLVSSQVLLKGTTVEMEQFANLPLTGGVFLAILLIRSQANPWKFMWVGLLGAISILYKIIFVAPLAVAGISLFTMLWLERDQEQAVKRNFLRLVWMLFGFIIPLMIVAAYFASHGLLGRLALVFKIGFGYMQGGGMFDWLPPPFGFPVFWMAVNNAALLIFGLLGGYRIVRRAIPLKNTDSVVSLILALWLVISLMEAGLRRGSWEHYALLVVPPLSLMAALEISAAYHRWKSTTAQLKARLGMGIMTGLVILNFGAMNYAFYSQDILYKFGYISREQFAYGYIGTSGTGPGAFYAEIIGSYLQARTTPNDRIYLASNNVQSYYYADRKPPVEVLSPDYLFLSGPPDQIFDPRTKYIVLDTPDKINHPQWLMDGLKHNYHLETTIGGQEIYRRNSS